MLHIVIYTSSSKNKHKTPTLHAFTKQFLCRPGKGYIKTANRLWCPQWVIYREYTFLWESTERYHPLAFGVSSKVKTFFEVSSVFSVICFFPPTFPSYAVNGYFSKLLCCIVDCILYFVQNLVQLMRQHNIPRWPATKPFFHGSLKLLQIECHIQHHTALLSAGAKLALRSLSALFIPMAHQSLAANANSRQVTVPIVL